MNKAASTQARLRGLTHGLNLSQPTGQLVPTGSRLAHHFFFDSETAFT